MFMAMEVCLAVDRIEPYSERPGAERWRANQVAPRIKDNPLRAAEPPKASWPYEYLTHRQEGLLNSSSVFRPLERHMCFSLDGRGRSQQQEARVSIEL